MEHPEVLAAVREKADLLGLHELAGADSLVVVELVMDVEDLFGIELTEDDVQGAATLEELADRVLAKLS